MAFATITTQFRGSENIVPPFILCQIRGFVLKSHEESLYQVLDPCEMSAQRIYKYVTEIAVGVLFQLFHSLDIRVE